MVLRETDVRALVALPEDSESASWCCGIWNTRRPTSSTSSPSCGWPRPARSPAPPSGWACPSRSCRRRVARLEEQLGARLLTRSARGAQPTDVGQAYYERAAAILADLEAAQEVVAEAVTQIAGPIRLTAPLSFGISYLAPALAEFARLHPGVELDIEFEDRNVDLVGGGYDLGGADRQARRFRRWSPAASRRCASTSSPAPPISTRTAARTGRRPRRP